MTTEVVDAAPASVRGRWYAPRTWIGTVAFFVAGYLIVQPLAYWAFSRWGFYNRPLDMSPRAWLRFVAIVAGIGAVAGTCWWWAERIRYRWPRWTVRSYARWLAICCFTGAERIAMFPLRRSLTVLALTALIAALLFSWIERWSHEEKTRAAK